MLLLTPFTLYEIIKGMESGLSTTIEDDLDYDEGRSH